MRFHVGPPSPNAGFEPEAGGWTKLKEPGPWVMQLCAIPIAVVLGGTLAFAGSWAGPIRWTGGWPLIVVIVLLEPVHETIHALTHPGNGRKRDTIVGLWPQRLLFYAHYDAALSRNRFLAILIMPLLAMSVLPLLITAVMGISLDWIVAVVVVNGLAAAGDVFGCLLVLFQVPANATVRNKGYYTWWQVSAT